MALEASEETEETLDEMDEKLAEKINGIERRLALLDSVLADE